MPVWLAKRNRRFIWRTPGPRAHVFRWITVFERNKRIIM
jgi:hypothetical protein